MTCYYYLDVLLTIDSKEKVQVDIYKLKQIIIQSVKDLFGEAGASNQIDILKYTEQEGRIILRQEGKDLIIFATADDHKEPSKVTLPEPERQAGLILPNGEINWNCPCLGGMATGPCGVEFREAFSCFHKSEADPKGSDCYNAFKEMHLCMAEYPQVYNKYDNVDDDDDGDIDEKGLDFELTEKEKALISDNTVKEQVMQKDKISSNPKVEEKSPEKKALTEAKKSPPSGTLKINS